MAKTSKFCYTNNAENQNVTIKFDQMDLKTSYTPQVQVPNEYICTNMAITDHEEEVIRLKTGSDFNEIREWKDLPNNVPTGTKYAQAILECKEVYRTEDPAFNFVQDSPIWLKTNIMWAEHAEITEAVLLAALTRQISAFFRNDGTSRLDQLMVQGPIPNEN